MEAKLKVTVNTEQAVAAIDGMQDLIEAAKTFCSRVESGEVRSVKSYKAFTSALEKLKNANADNVPIEVSDDRAMSFYRTETGQPSPPDIEEELGQLLIAVDNSLDFIHNGPRVAVQDPKAVEDQYNRHILKIIPLVKSVLASRVAVKYPLTDLVDMTYAQRHGYGPEVYNDMRYRDLFDGHNKLAASGKSLVQTAANLLAHTKVGKGVAPKGDVIMLGLCMLLIDMQQIMRLFGWTMDDVRLAAREYLTRYDV